MPLITRYRHTVRILREIHKKIHERHEGRLVKQIFWLFPIEETIQAVHVESITDARSPNHCCRGKATIITYSECVFVALVTQHAKRMQYYTVICDPSGSTTFFLVIS